VLHRIIYQRPLITISTMVAENSHTKPLALLLIYILCEYRKYNFVSKWIRHAVRTDWSYLYMYPRGNAVHSSTKCIPACFTTAWDACCYQMDTCIIRLVTLCPYWLLFWKTLSAYFLFDNAVFMLFVVLVDTA